MWKVTKQSQWRANVTSNALLIRVLSLGSMAKASNPITWEAEGGGFLWVQCLHGLQIKFLCRETLSQKSKRYKLSKFKSENQVLIKYKVHHIWAYIERQWEWKQMGQINE